MNGTKKGLIIQVKNLLMKHIIRANVEGTPGFGRADGGSLGGAEGVRADGGGLGGAVGMRADDGSLGVAAKVRVDGGS